MESAFVWSPVVAGTLTALLFPLDKAWYASLKKPSWTPPSWAFGPVWTFLYIVMGLAARRIWTLEKRVSWPLMLWMIQLMLNLAWTPTFFGARNPAGALYIMVALLVTVCLTIAAFWNIDTSASIMLVPYLIWLLIAWSLNVYIVEKTTNKTVIL